MTVTLVFSFGQQGQASKNMRGAQFLGYVLVTVVLMAAMVVVAAVVVMVVLVVRVVEVVVV